ncbi:hypothetical protein EDD21DRAFT_352487 [Dissophora ornata]|nr:hypothetical protein EDD21DRAFT_352487 [Dissophora ornata]
MPLLLLLLLPLELLKPDEALYVAVAEADVYEDGVRDRSTGDSGEVDTGDNGDSGDDGEDQDDGGDDEVGLNVTVGLRPDPGPGGLGNEPGTDCEDLVHPLAVVVIIAAKKIGGDSLDDGEAKEGDEDGGEDTKNQFQKAELCRGRGFCRRGSRRRAIDMLRLPLMLLLLILVSMVTLILLLL